MGTLGTFAAVVFGVWLVLGIAWGFLSNFLYPEYVVDRRARGLDADRVGFAIRLQGSLDLTFYTRVWTNPAYRWRFIRNQLAFFAVYLPTVLMVLFLVLIATSEPPS